MMPRNAAQQSGERGQQRNLVADGLHTMRLRRTNVERAAREAGHTRAQEWQAQQAPAVGASESTKDRPGRSRISSATAVPGAVILGVEYQALGVLRQLSDSGVRCVLVDEDRWGVARFSRCSAAFFQSPSYNSDQFWPWLTKLQEREGLQGWVLVPTDDEQVRQIALNIEEANRRFRYAGPDWNSYEKLYDKRRCYEWCLQNSISAPRSYLPKTRDDLPGTSLKYPFIVKPAFKRNFKRYSKAKAIAVNSEGDLRILLDELLKVVEIQELIYQEIIPGGGKQQWSYAGLFVEGDPVAAFTARRLRQHPPDFGRASTYVVSEHDAEVELESRKVLAALKHTGLAEVEWKRDPRDGELRFLEVNARFWGWHALSSRVFGNLPMMLYDYLHRSEVKPVAAHYGARWVKHITDVPVVFDLWRRRDLTFGEYLKSLRGDLICCEWERGDPWPFFLQFFLIPYLVKRRGY